MKRSVTIQVSNAAGVSSFGTIAQNALANEVQKTTVEIRPSYLSEEVIGVFPVNQVTKKVTVYGLEEGTYFAVIKRAGHLERAFNFTVGASNLVLADKPLIPGDINDDGAIDAVDVAIIHERAEANFELENDLKLDLNGDGKVDSFEAGILTENYGLDVSVYNEDVDFDN